MEASPCPLVSFSEGQRPSMDRALAFKPLEGQSSDDLPAKSIPRGDVNLLLDPPSGLSFPAQGTWVLVWAGQGWSSLCPKEHPLYPLPFWSLSLIRHSWMKTSSLCSLLRSCPLIQVTLIPAPDLVLNRGELARTYGWKAGVRSWGPEPCQDSSLPHLYVLAGVAPSSYQAG